jgi:hypothetical protein
MNSPGITKWVSSWENLAVPLASREAESPITSFLFWFLWFGGGGIFKKNLVAASQPCQCHLSNFAEMS